MRKNKTLTMNEQKRAELYITNSACDENNLYNCIWLVGTYYYYCVKLRKTGIEKPLIEYIEKAAPDIYNENPNKWNEIAESISRHVGGVKLSNVNYIPITENELKVIDSLDNRESKRLLFTMLVVAKWQNGRRTNNNNWLCLDRDYNKKIGASRYSYIFKLAHVKDSLAERAIRIGELTDCGFLEAKEKIDSLDLRVTFAECNEESKEVMQVKDLSQLGLLYRYEIEKDCSVSKCEDCGDYYLIGRWQAINKAQLIANGVEIKGCLCPKCKEARKLIIPTLIKKICVDCGGEFWVNARVQGQQVRCPECQHEHRKAQDRARKRKKVEFLKAS